MSDEPFDRPNRTPNPLRQSKPGERLWMMQKGTRYAECELRFHGESYGWEVQMFRDGELFSSRGALVTRGMAIQWAEPERREMGREGWTLVGTKGEA